MVVAHIIAEESLQVEIVQGDDVVQKVPPTTLNPSLRDSVLPRTLERSPNRAYGHRPYCDGDFQAILGVPIKNQKSGSGLIREGLPQLLNDPSRAGVTGDIEVHNLATAVTDNEEALKHGT
jgi:hypothetical protein